MKKNLTRKLALSAVTMGVAALTVTSTTYAWYTTNATASATGLKATTETAQGALLIQSGNDEGDNINSQKSSINLKAGFKPTYKLPDLSSKKLTPAQWAKKNDSDASESWIGLDKKDATVNNYYIWFHATIPAQKLAKISFTLSNVVFSARVKQTLTVNNKENSNESSDIYVIRGLQDVLAIKVSEIHNETNETTSNVTSLKSGNYRYLDEGNITNSTGDALTYYNNVMGTNETRPNDYFGDSNRNLAIADSQEAKSSTYGGTKINDFVTINNNSDEIKTVVFGLCFTFFIDGWDKDCYNCVGGTSITSGTFTFDIDTTTGATTTTA